jgi:hypothetical protein
LTDFAEIIGEIGDLEIIAAGNALRDRARLRRLYGGWRWRQMKGVARILASAGKRSSVSGTSTKRPSAASLARRPRGARFVVCVDNTGYEASLERNKIYVALPDAQAENDGDIRVIDESGEDYLFSAKRFIAIEVPQAVRASLLRAS